MQLGKYSQTLFKADWNRKIPQLRMQELKQASLLDLPFRTAGCFIRPSFVELSGEIIYEVEQRLSVQLKSCC